MQKTIDFYFDVGSPTAYLAHKRLTQLAALYPLKVRYKPMLLGGIFKGSGNTSPITVPAKGAYMLQHDLPRFARRYQVILHPNPFFPINTLGLMRMAIAAQQLDCSEAFNSAVFDAIWVTGKNMGDPEVVATVLSQHQLDAATLLKSAQTPANKTALITATEAALAKGIFGAPTMFMDDVMYFGQDRLDFVEEALQIT